MRFTFVLLLWRFCGGVAAAAPENKNPPVRIASGGCVVSDVKGGAGLASAADTCTCGSRFPRAADIGFALSRLSLKAYLSWSFSRMRPASHYAALSSVAAPVSFAVPAPCAAPVSCRGPCSECGRRRCTDGGRGYLRGSFRSGPKLAGAILHSGRSSDSFPAVRLPDRRVSGVVHDLTSAEAELTAASTVPASHRIPF